MLQSLAGSNKGTILVYSISKFNVNYILTIKRLFESFIDFIKLVEI